MRNKRKITIKKTGFTIVELVVAIAIVAVLAAGAIVSLTGLIDKAKDSVQIASMKNIDTFISTKLILGDFSDNQLYTYKKNQASGNEDYFSRYLEANWDIINNPSDDSDNTNALNIVNAYSGKKGVVNWQTPESIGALYQNQAFYITTSKKANYTPGSPTTIDSCYKGALVLWYDANKASHIYLYYVDVDGLQSEKHYVY